MRRILLWLSATAVVCALLVGYQVVYAAGDSGDGDKGRACPATATAEPDPTATHCEPADDSRSGSGATDVRTGKPGERK